MINKVILVGNLGKDPEARETRNGRALSKFVVATSRNVKDRDGDLQERTEWHNCEAWGKLAEICNKFLTKGRQVYIEGHIKYDKYEDTASGTTRHYTSIVVENMKMLGGGKKQRDEPSAPAESSDEVPF